MPTVTVGRRATLRAALRATSPDLLAYFERRVPAREDAADLLSDVMLQAWRRQSKLPDDPERQRMWLFTIAANVLSNHHRSTRRRSTLADKLKATLNDAPVVPDATEHLAVRDAVLRLHDAQRELVMLIHWDGFSIVEAAELLGLNASTARSRYAAARDTLRQALSDNACV